MKQVNKAVWMPVGIGAGIAIGAGIGAATDNLAMWLALGVASGSGLGVALMGLSGVKRADKKNEEAAPLTDGVPCVNSHHSAGSDGGGDGGGD